VFASCPHEITAIGCCSGRILHPENDGGSNKSHSHMRASRHHRRPSSGVADAHNVERPSEVHATAELLARSFSSYPLRPDGRVRGFPSNTIFWRGMLQPFAVTAAAHDFTCTLCQRADGDSELNARLGLILPVKDQMHPP
jgi:hypothetical protein